MVYQPAAVPLVAVSKALRVVAACDDGVDFDFAEPASVVEFDELGHDVVEDQQ